MMDQMQNHDVLPYLSCSFIIRIFSSASVKRIITMDESRKTRDLFLCGIALMYLFAFGSWFVQIPGKKAAACVHGWQVQQYAFR